MNKQQKLKDDTDMCIVKLDRANKLIGGLGGEKSRWTEPCAKLGAPYDLLPGDCLITSGLLSYAGPYTGTFR